MNCVSENKGEFLCINQFCDCRNSYICSDPKDACKKQHESCSLINLTYLVKNCAIQVSGNSSIGQSKSRSQILTDLEAQAKTLAETISLALQVEVNKQEICDIFGEGKPLKGRDKEKIAKFISDQKSEGVRDQIFFKVEKQLQEFEPLIHDFNAMMREIRYQEIEELKNKIKQEEKSWVNQTPKGSQLKHKHRGTSQLQAGSRESSINKKSVDGLESPIKAMKARKISEVGKREGETKQPKAEQEYESRKSSMVRSKVQERNKQAIGINFKEKLSTILQGHVPKGPLFSKITNDIKTLNDLFSDQFSSAKLLYRASQHDFHVNKFHESCDGIPNTLTLILTEFDKTIGGFTPLPWKSGGGEWYQDSSGKSFIFNLTSGEKYPLLMNDRAIWCSRTFGPSFGHPDLQISDRAFSNSNSCVNFPMCYNNGNYKNTPISIEMFCGTKSGHFRIREWEVYELTFA